MEDVLVPTHAPATGFTSPGGVLKNHRGVLMNMLAQLSLGESALAWLLILICCLLMLVILLQRGRGGGLSAAFGGAGGSAAFGAKTGDVFTWVTVVVATIFVLLNVVSNYAFDKSLPKVQPPVVQVVPTDAETGEDEEASPIQITPIDGPPPGVNLVPVGGSVPPEGTGAAPGDSEEASPIKIRPIDGPPPGVNLVPVGDSPPPPGTGATSEEPAPGSTDAGAGGDAGGSGQGGAEGQPSP
jgi:preprotein translocase subunit SecG